MLTTQVCRPEFGLRGLQWKAITNSSKLSSAHQNHTHTKERKEGEKGRKKEGQREIGRRKRREERGGRGGGCIKILAAIRKYSQCMKGEGQNRPLGIAAQHAGYRSIQMTTLLITKSLRLCLFSLLCLLFPILESGYSCLFQLS